MKSEKCNNGLGLSQLKKAVFILIVFITIIFTVNTAVSTNLDSNKSISTNNQVKTSAVPENSEINESFHKISDIEYNEKKYNCKHKSEAFAAVLIKNDANNVYLVTIGHQSGQYSHMVVSWNDKIYDATARPSVYGMPEKEYFNMIKKCGFNGLRVKEPYTSK